MWCQKWCLHWLFLLLIWKYKVIKHAKKENTNLTTRIMLQWKRPEEGKEKKDVARLQMMYRLGKPPLSPVIWTGVKLVTWAAQAVRWASPDSSQESQRTHNVNISKASVESQREDKEGRRAFVCNTLQVKKKIGALTTKNLRVKEKSLYSRVGSN